MATCGFVSASTAKASSAVAAGPHTAMFSSSPMMSASTGRRIGLESTISTPMGEDASDDAPALTSRSSEDGRPRSSFGAERSDVAGATGKSPLFVLNEKTRKARGFPLEGA